MIWFIHRDSCAFDRQSDGLAMMKREDGLVDEMYFGCLDYGFVSTTFDEKDAVDALSNVAMRPATLEEICHIGKIGDIDSILEFKEQKDKLKTRTCIHINAT